jgi:hypothetical protein
VFEVIIAIENDMALICSLLALILQQGLLGSCTYDDEYSALLQARSNNYVGDSGGGAPSGWFTSWPATNKNCNEICQANGQTCHNPDNQKWGQLAAWDRVKDEDKAESLYTAMGYSCGSYIPSGSGLVKETSRNQCYYPTDNALFSCTHKQTNYIPLCPCGDPPGGMEFGKCEDKCREDGKYIKLDMCGKESCDGCCECTGRCDVKIKPPANWFTSWPATNKNCNEICQANGQTCSNPANLKWGQLAAWDLVKDESKATSLYTAMGYSCGSYIPSGSGLVKEASRNQCYYPTDNALFSCTHKQTNYIPLCPCGDPPGVVPTTTTTSTTTTPTTTTTEGKVQSCDDKCYNKKNGKIKGEMCEKNKCAACAECDPNYNGGGDGEDTCDKVKCYNKQSGNMKRSKCGDSSCAACSECGEDPGHKGKPKPCKNKCHNKKGKIRNNMCKKKEMCRLRRMLDTGWLGVTLVEASY